MENNQFFVYRYSAKQNKEIEEIRKKYLPKEESPIDTLRKLDRSVQNAGMIESLSIGIIGCLIFGIGMCFGFEVFAGASWLAVLFCLIGALVMLPAYPIYRLLARKTKERLSPKILSLSEEIINPKNSNQEKQD